MKKTKKFKHDKRNWNVMKKCGKKRKNEKRKRKKKSIRKKLKQKK